MPRLTDDNERRVLCSWCGSADTRPKRKYFLHHPDIGQWIKRSYHCQACDQRFETAEVHLGQDGEVDTLAAM